MIESPLGVAEAFRRAFEDASATGIADCFTDDADFVNVVGLWFRGRRQIEFNHAIGFRDMFPSVSMTFEDTSVCSLGPEVAVVRARLRMTGQVGATGARRGMLMFVCQRQDDGGWLAVSGQNTDIIDGAQTLLPGADGIVRPARY